MKKVIVTAGPRGAGKTTVCKEVVERYPEIILVERDAILVYLFGKTSICPYSGGHHRALEQMWGTVRHHINTAEKAESDITLILDTWNGSEWERWKIVEKLRDFGVDYVEAWDFQTPEDVVVERFLARENVSAENRRGRGESCRIDCRFYRSQPVTLKQGFDYIRIIDPTQLTLFPLPDLILSNH